MRPIEAPISGPKARLIMKYAPPASTAPLVDIAHTEVTVNAMITKA